MRKVKLLILIITYILTQNLYSQAWKLVWSDEFDGTTLNTTNWTRETGGDGWGNNELEYYTNRDVNAFVSDGLLTIKAINESYGGRSYTSARLITKGKRFFKYGKIEARIKLPYGQGIWPAFWTLGQNISTAGWPACGEIDIMEMIGGGVNRDNRVYGTGHWDNNGHQSYGLNYTLPSGNFSDDFHIFSIVWDANKIDWYCDNNKYCTLSLTPSYIDELKAEHFILLNLAVGGNWPGNPNGTTVFPQTMQVDYVRVYKDTLGLPSINMTSPSNNSIFNPGETINLTADAGQAANIKKVEFLQDAVKIGETSIKPYSINWKNVQPGCYNVSALVTTLSGQTVQSAPVSVKVGSACGRSAYKGYPQIIPGKIEAENFDNGGANTAYYDSDAGNTAGFYRTGESVDIENCYDAGGGFDVTSTAAGEWLKYSVEAAEGTVYNFNFRAVSTSAAGSDLRLYIDDADVTGIVHIPYTGANTWVYITKGNISLTKGTHDVKLLFVTAGSSVNYIEVVKTNAPYYLKLLTPNGGEKLPKNSAQEITWESSRVEALQIGLTTDNGENWILVSGDYPAIYGVCRFNAPDVESSNCKVMIIDKSNPLTNSSSAAAFSLVNSTGVIDEAVVDGSFKLFQNYPNPFNPQTAISYRIKTAGMVKMVISDAIGKEIKTLVNEYKPAGIYTVPFHAANLNSGVYYCTLYTGGFSQTSKMLLIK
jgi:beta-glucanase (GH16 family)